MNLQEILAAKKASISVKEEEIEEEYEPPVFEEELFYNLCYIFVTTPKLSYTDWRLLADYLTWIPWVRGEDAKLHLPLLEKMVLRMGFIEARLKSYFLDTNIGYKIQDRIWKNWD